MCSVRVERAAQQLEEADRRLQQHARLAARLERGEGPELWEHVLLEHRHQRDALGAAGRRGSPNTADGGGGAAVRSGRAPWRQPSWPARLSCPLGAACLSPSPKAYARTPKPSQGQASASADLPHPDAAAVAHIPIVCTACGPAAARAAAHAKDAWLVEGTWRTQVYAPPGPRSFHSGGALSSLHPSSSPTSLATAVGSPRHS
eukprot:scaffold15509_cov66-Phaeocystis_antarctica.AAC.6